MTAEARSRFQSFKSISRLRWGKFKTPSSGALNTYPITSFPYVGAITTLSNPRLIHNASTFRVNAAVSSAPAPVTILIFLSAMVSMLG